MLGILQGYYLFEGGRSAFGGDNAATTNIHRVCTAIEGVAFALLVSGLDCLKTMYA